MITEKAIAGYEAYAGAGNTEPTVEDSVVIANATVLDESTASEVSFKNVYNTDNLSISGKKTWTDYNNAHNLRPTTIGVALQISIDSGATWEYATDYFKTLIGTSQADVLDAVLKAVENKEATKNGGWAAEYKNLPVGKDSTVYQYRIVETKVGDAEVSINGNDYTYLGSYQPIQGTTTVATAAQTTIKNQMESVELTISKTWGDSSNAHKTRPNNGKLTFVIQSRSVNETDFVDVKDVDGKSVKVSFSTESKDSGSLVVTLPSKDIDGDLVYRAREEKVNGYQTPEVVSEDKKQITYKNSLDTIDFSGTKTWNDRDDLFGFRPSAVAITLYRQVGNGAKEQVTGFTPNWTMPEGNDDQNQWAYRYSGLPKYNHQGDEYAYTVEETKVDSYKKSPTATSANNYALVNDLDMVTASGMKNWNESALSSYLEKANIRPAIDEVELALYYTIGNETTEIRATDIWQNQFAWAADVDETADSWAYSFKDLPKYSSDGKVLNYFVKEESVFANYEPTVQGNNITNVLVAGSLETEKICARGDKDQAFTFRISFAYGDVNLGAYEGDYVVKHANATVMKGTTTDGSVQIKAGETFTIENIPVGMSYKVTEDKEAHYPLEQKSGDEGMIQKIAQTLKLERLKKQPLRTSMCQDSTIP